MTGYPQPRPVRPSRIIADAAGRGLVFLDVPLDQWIWRIDVLRCLDDGCATAAVTVAAEVSDDDDDIGPTNGVALGSDGNPLLGEYKRGCVVAFCDSTQFLGHCADPVCSSLDQTTFTNFIDDDNVVSTWNDSLDVGGDGLGTFVSAKRSPPGPVELRRCTDLACAGLTAPLALDSGPLSWSSLRHGADGYPLVAYARQGEVRILRADVPTGSADLAVTKTDGVDAAAPGDRLTYTIVASNAGPNSVTGAQLGDPLPAELVEGVWSCVASPGSSCLPASGTGDVLSSVSMPAGGSAVFTLTATLDGAAVSPVSNTATITPPAGLVDPQPGNNSATDTDTPAGGPIGVSIGDAFAGEGDAGTTPALLPLTLSRPSNASVSVDWATLAGGTATPGSDYLPASGSVVFAPGETAAVVSVSVVGDTLVETDETFRVGLSSASGAVIADGQATATIADDDAPSLSRDELAHGSSQYADLRAQPGPAADRDYYRLAQPPRSSWEVDVDATSGDVAPLVLERLAADGVSVLQTAAAGVGGSASLRFENPLPGTVTNQHLAVRSGGCSTGCDASAVYRIRAWETTNHVARFNDSASQVTLLLLANAGAKSVSGTVWYWSGSGALLASEAFNLAPRATLVRDTSQLPGLSGASGSISVSHNGSYGVLTGKAVALEPATGFSFDTPLTSRSR